MNNLKLLFVTFLLINTSLIAQFNWDNADWSGLSFGDLGGSVNFHIADINQYPSMQCSVTQNQQITYNCYTQSNLCGNSSCVYTSSADNMGMGATYNCTTTQTVTTNTLKDCNNICNVSHLNFVGDGICHDSSPNFRCEELDWDGGDCEPIVEYCNLSQYVESIYKPDGYNTINNDLCNEFIVYGCRDLEAFNYNEEANIDDESCIAKVFYCDNTTTSNASPSLTYLEGLDENLPDGYNTHLQSLCHTIIVEGCTNAEACEYDFSNPANYNPGNYLCTTSSESIDNTFSATWENSLNKTKLTWENKCTSDKIDQYIIYKRIKNSGSVWDEILLENQCSGISSNVPQIDQQNNLQYYLDEVTNLQGCPTYEYQIKTVKCSKFEALTSIKEVQANLSLSNSFDENDGKSLTVSTGDFENRVELLWDNNNSAVIYNFEIYRREYNPQINTPYILIGETSNDIQHFIDYNVDPYVLYQYYINAVVPSCESTSTNNLSSTKHQSDPKIGFRKPLVEIHGQIDYGQGFGVVQDVNLSGKPVNPINNKSLDISIYNNSLVLPSSNSDFSLMAWFYINQVDGYEKTILSGFFDSQNSVKISSNNFIQVNGVEYGETLDNWRNIAITYNHSNSLLSIYVDGNKIQDLNKDLSYDSNLILCEEFNGLIDEISFWNTTLEENFIKNNYDNYLKYDSDGLIGYYHCDEELGDFIYDYSINENNALNKNHIKLNSLINNFSDLSTNNKVSYSSVTDVNGYYSIEQIRFGKNGTNFEVTPRKVNVLSNTPHEFSPAKLTTHIGDGTNSLANFNFIDESSFRFTGSVYYLDPSINESESCNYSTSPNYNNLILDNCPTDISHLDYDNNSNFGVSGVKILIDGNEIYGDDGNIEQTDADGNFDIQVPIGLHEISIEKNGHTFVRYKWDTHNHITINDTSRYYNFNSDVYNIKFYDNTKRTLIGKVCGGVLEASRLLDPLSENNIGEASFYLADISNKHKVQVNTDSITGEYSVDLLPISYNVKLNENNNRIEVEQNESATDFFTHRYSYSEIDLSEKGDDLNSYDKIRNYIYRTSPVIYLYTSTFTNPDTDQIQQRLGEVEWSILNQSFNESTQKWESQTPIIIPIYDNSGISNFTYPVFKKGVEYDIITMVSESYVNHQTQNNYNEPVTSGLLTFSSDNTSQSFEINGLTTVIPFTPNNINTSLASSNSFLKNFTVSYQNGNIVYDNNIDYYVFGSQVDQGLNFFSSGPEVVEMVLRDPPGDLSYSFIESGSSHKNSVEIYSSGDVISNHIQKDINLGTKLQFSIPFGGPILTTEIIANTQIDIEFESVIDNTEETSYETSIGQGFRTSNNQFNIGSGGDVYIANNYNLVYGTNKNLEIINTNLCGNQGIVCKGESSENPSEMGEYSGTEILFSSGNNDYTIGTSVGLEIVPTGFKTKTVYDQNHILNNLIPSLKWIRNTYFGLSQVYQRVDNNPDNICYDNLTHPLYNEIDNPEPCYKYNEDLDYSDPYVLPFNLFEDINIADYIPDDFVSLIENQLIESQLNGDTELSESTLETIKSIIAIYDTGANALDAIDNILDSQLWSDFSSYLGAQNLLLGVDAFKSEVLDFYENQIEDATNGLEQLQSVLDNLQHTVPKDKVSFYNQQIKLWEQAILENELDKASIFDNDYSESTFNSIAQNNLTYGADQNYSISAGNVIEESYRVTNNTSNLNTISYTIDGEIAYEIGGRIQGVGGSYQDVIPISFAVEKNITESDEEFMEFGYVLSDDDESDYLSVDVKTSNKGWGPIFRKRAGQTMCPHETEEEFLFHQLVDSENNLFSPATQPREVPEILVSPSIIQGVPESQPAVFNLTLINNSASQEDIVYTIMVDEASNPYGAILNIDGQSVYREIMVPYGQSINKTLTVHKGPNRLFYTDESHLVNGEDNRLAIILRSSCQYSYGNSNTLDIADTVKFGVSYLPGCTDVSISKPIDNWILNKTTEDILNSNTLNNLSIKLEGYDFNYYSLDNIILEYKESSASELEYDQIRNFIKSDPPASLSSNEEILQPANVTIEWDMHQLDDGNYDIRAYSECGGVRSYSEVKSGHKDTRKPEPFGSPQPADGILSANDDVLLNWSEAIDETEFYSRTDVRMNAVLNNSSFSHDAHVYIDSENALEIPRGINLKNKSFTIEMWINPLLPGTLFKQGHENNRLKISIDENHKLVTTYEVSDQVIQCNSFSLINLTDESDAWQHLAIVFDNELKTISYVINGALANSDVSSFLTDYIGEGPIYIGDDGFEGSIHNLRIWSSSKNVDNINDNISNRLIGNENGLVGYWPMDELFGSANDLARMRHISSNIQWSVSKKGYGYDFVGNNAITIPIQDINYDLVDDFTIEFWFKTSETNQCIMSTESIDDISVFGNFADWRVIIDENGFIKVENNNSSNNVILTSQEIFSDNIWHHFALVKNGKSNTSLFIDNIEQSVIPSTNTSGLIASQLTFGSKSIYDGNQFNYFDFFEGKVDEIRIWGLSRGLSQLDRYKNIRQTGSELGLDLYFPFENYQDGSSMLSFSNIDFSSNSISFNDINQFSYESIDLPLIRMSNPYLPLDFTALVNQDQTLLNITNNLNEIEGVIVDVSIDNIFDLYSNKANPVSWSFYVDKNQLIWDESSISINKKLGDFSEFDTRIINSSGTVESYQISNLPDWLSVSSSNGLIEPNSFEEVTFIINESLFIGDYSQQILLTGNNGVSESLILEVNVEAEQPEIPFAEQDYQYNMSFIGKVSVDGIRSRDELDLLVAYVGDEARGKTNPIFIEEYDAYFIFMSVYSNNIIGDQINFRLWDASEGKTQSQVKINGLHQIEFVDGSTIGSFDSLAQFEATNTLIQEIILSEGWNWISLNLETNDNSELGEVLIPTVTSELNSNNIDVFRSQSSFAQYDELVGWLGSMNSLELKNMYQIKINNMDTLVYEGVPVDLSNSIYNIDITNGWNWIGYLGQRPLNINMALSSLVSLPGDLIKSQMNFSVYASESIGWLGTLNTLNEGEGYMLKSGLNQTLIYPESSLYGSGGFRLEKNKNASNYWTVKEHNFENSMNIIAKINNYDGIEISENNILGAFSQNECVGNISPIYSESNQPLYFLTVYGDNEKLIKFKYYDSENNIVLNADNDLIFEKNKLVGSYENPYEIELDYDNHDIDDALDFNIIPNPFNDKLELRFTLEQDSSFEIKFYDMTGRVVKTLKRDMIEYGNHEMLIKTDELNLGYYIIEVEIDNKKIRKSIIKS